MCINSRQFLTSHFMSIYQQTNMADCTSGKEKKEKLFDKLKFILIGELSVALENSNYCY